VSRCVAGAAASIPDRDESHGDLAKAEDLERKEESKRGKRTALPDVAFRTRRKEGLIVMRYVLCILSLMVVGISAASQAAGRHTGIVVGVYVDDGYGWGTSMLFHLDHQNNPSGFATGSAAWPLWSQHYGMTLDVDNQTVIVPAALDTNNQRMALVRYDPALPGIIGTIWSGAASPHDWSNITLDANGNVALLDVSSPKGTQIKIFDRFSSTWRSQFVQTRGRPGMGGLVWDKARGGFLHANDWIDLYRTSYDLAVTTPVAPSPGSPHGAHYGGDLAGNGDWISSSRGTASAVYYVSRGASSMATAVLPATKTAKWFDDVTMEKWAAPGAGFYASGLLASGTNISGGVYYVSRSPSVSTLRIYDAANLRFMWPYFATGPEVVPLHTRDLATLRSGAATWHLAVNPGNPAFAGKPYVIAASLTGARPAVVLADGRELFLRPDALTALSVTGPVPPFLTHNTGVLGLRGSAVANLDFSSVGTAFNGTVIHFCGVVLDPTASHGIAWVLEPWAFVVDVLPS